MTGDPTERAIDGLVARLDYPMFVVTTVAGDDRAGCLVGFATQVSISPARLLIGLSVRNHTYRVATRATALAVHALEPEQRDLASLFGTMTGDQVDKFTRCAWRRGPFGLPILDGVAAWAAGPIIERVPFGDHVGHVVEPEQGGGGGHGPVLGFRHVQDLDPGHPA